MKTVSQVLTAARRERVDPSAKDRVRRALAVSIAGAGALTTASAAASSNGIAAGSASALTVTKLVGVLTVVASVSGGAVWLAGTRHAERMAAKAPLSAPQIVEAPPQAVGAPAQAVAAPAQAVAAPAQAVAAPPTKPASIVASPARRAPDRHATPPKNTPNDPPDTFAAELAALDAAQAALRDRAYAKADALAKESLATSPKTPFAHELLFVRAVAACGLGISNPHLDTLAALDATLHARAVAHCRRIEEK